VSVRPAANDAQHPRNYSEHFPIDDKRPPADACVAHPDEGQSQDEKVGQKSEKTRRPAAFHNAVFIFGGRRELGHGNAFPF
jgi:hypothetical protein